MGTITKEKNKYRIRWKRSDGSRGSKYFRKNAAAKKALAKLEAEAEEMRVGLRPQATPAHTFSELCEYWIEHRASRKKSDRHDKSIIRRHLRPNFGNLQVGEVTLEVVDAFRRRICPDERFQPGPNGERPPEGQVSPKTLHNVLTLLISILNLGVELGWMPTKPNVKKPKLLPANYSYLRSRDDIKDFLAAAHREGPDVYALYACALFTGMRAGELLGLTWADVDLKRRLITVQHSYSSTTKTDEVRHVPILDALLPTLKEWKLRCPSSTWVFPTKVGTMHQPSARVLQETLKRVLKEAKISYRMRFHDLRHTFASHWMMGGGDLFRLQKVLGHKSAEMTQRYSHLSPHVFEQDYGVLGDPPARADISNVHQLPTARRRTNTREE